MYHTHTIYHDDPWTEYPCLIVYPFCSISFDDVISYTRLRSLESIVFEIHPNEVKETTRRQKHPTAPGLSIPLLLKTNTLTLIKQPYSITTDTMRLLKSSTTTVLFLVIHSIGLWNDVTSFTVVGPTTKTSATKVARSFSSSSLPTTTSTTIHMATVESTTSGDGSSNSTTNEPPTNPMLNGKRVLPLKILQGGLKSSTSPIAAVYVVLNSDYKTAMAKPNPSSWTAYCEHVGTTTDLKQTLIDHVDEYGVDRVSYIRAISFSTPNVGAMESIASDWRRDVILSSASASSSSSSGTTGVGKTNFDPILAAMDLETDDDDDFDDDDDDDDYFEMMAGAMAASRSGLADARGIDVNAEDEKRKQQQQQEEVISPFQQYSTTAAPGSIPFNKESVDTVLEEIRPYLISDGGNVSVERVDEQTQDVYLKLQGACGSCPSSTVTMQMGIERVLKENFPNLGQVLQVEDETDGASNSELDIVQQEVDRIKPAIIAMGGKVDIINVDAENGDCPIEL